MLRWNGSVAVHGPLVCADRSRNGELIMARTVNPSNGYDQIHATVMDHWNHMNQYFWKQIKQSISI